MAYSSLVPLNLKSTGTISWNPSPTLGSLKREKKLLKANFGRSVLPSGFIWPDGQRRVALAKTAVEVVKGAEGAGSSREQEQEESEKGKAKS
jgi:hypothetical protein